MLGYSALSLDYGQTFYVLIDPDPVRLSEHKEDPKVLLREQALAKLTPEEREALGV